MNGFVLKSNGSYQHISKLKIGDYLMNKYGFPTKVEKIRSVKSSKHSPLMSVKSLIFYESLICNQNQHILCWDGNETIWSRYEDLGKYYLATPSQYQWDMPNTFDYYEMGIRLEPSYEIGYVFGCFLRVGSLNKYRGAVFRFPNDKRFVMEKLIHFINKLFPTIGTQIFDRPLKRSKDFCIPAYNGVLVIFEEFLGKSHMVLPRLFYCGDMAYITGLADGMIQSNMNTKDIPSKDFLHTLYWTSLSCGRKLHYGLVNRKDKTSHDYICGKSRVLPHTEKYDLWNVYTDSGSFIINNMVVNTDYE